MKKLAFLTILAGATFGLNSAHAVSLNEALSVRNDVPIDGVDKVSYDGSGFDIFKPFSNVANTQNILSIGSFSGLSNGSNLSVTLLAEVACFDGEEIPGQANAFGVVDANGEFKTALDSTGVLSGGTGSVELAAGEEFTLGLKSPQGLFSSVDSKNKDGKAHIIGLKVEKSGTVVIPNANRAGASFTFDLLAGDILIFIEDMFLAGNKQHFGGIPADFDYNDMVLVVRQSPTAVPEPASMALLLGGLIGGAKARRKFKRT